MISTVGFVGLGAMGLPMTARLATHGLAMQVYDLDGRRRAAASAIAGVAAAESAAAVAGRVQVLFTCLPNDAVLRSVYLSDDGIARALRPGSVTVDCSTVSPGVTQEIHKALALRDVAHVDAAMLGSVPQAETGEIGFVIGGEAAACETIAPLLDILGRFRRHVGPSGAANRVKLIHQMLVAGHAAAVAEALAVCQATGTDLDAFYDVVVNGGGFAYSRYFEKRTPRMRAGDFSPLFMLQFMAKDAGLARDLARSVDLETPLLDQVLARFDAAKAEGLSEADFSAVARLYESAVGRTLADG